MTEASDPRERRRIIAAIGAAKNPIEYLKKAKQVPGVNPLIAMIEIRSLIQRSPGLRIESPNPIFATFYRANSSHSDFYKPLVTMLQMAGYERAEVVAMVEDFLDKENIDGKEEMLVALEVLFGLAISDAYGKSRRPT